MLTCLEYVHRLQHFFVSLFLLLFLNFDQLFKPNPTCTHAPLTLLPTWLFPTREKRILTDQALFTFLFWGPPSSRKIVVIYRHVSDFWGGDSLL